MISWLHLSDASSYTHVVSSSGFCIQSMFMPLTKGKREQRDGKVCTYLRTALSLSYEDLAFPILGARLLLSLASAIQHIYRAYKVETVGNVLIKRS